MEVFSSWKRALGHKGHTVRPRAEKAPPGVTNGFLLLRSDPMEVECGRVETVRSKQCLIITHKLVLQLQLDIISLTNNNGGSRQDPIENKNWSHTAAIGHSPWSVGEQLLQGEGEHTGSWLVGRIRASNSTLLTSCEQNRAIDFASITILFWNTFLFYWASIFIQFGWALLRPFLTYEGT